jgi:succinyl-diaminopimelate desuccinylase
MQADLETTLRRLVDAATPDGDEALALARDELEAAGLAVEVHDEAAALVARRGEAGLHLAGHVDVVPADPDAWPVDPATATRRDGALWGRGTADMLGAVAAFLHVAKREPDLPVGVVLTTDEETGMEGARRLVDAGALEDAEALVLGEPTDLRLGLAHKGVCWSDVVLAGATAHASMPDEGENPLDRLPAVLEALEGLDLEAHHPLLGPATLAVTRVHAGEARNQVPGEARVGSDARFPPPIVADDVVAALEDALEGIGHDLEVAFAIDPFEADARARLRALAREALEAQDRSGEGVGLPFGTEAGRYRRAVDEQVVLGPGDASLAHTAREHVPLEDVAAACRVYEALLRAWEGPDP